MDAAADHFALFTGDGVTTERKILSELKNKKSRSSIYLHFTYCMDCNRYRGKCQEEHGESHDVDEDESCWKVTAPDKPDLGGIFFATFFVAMA
jgi:hypothetical protein